MRLDEFYLAAERRANELGSKHFSVEVRLTQSHGSFETRYFCYLPEAHKGYQESETPEGALAKIGALDTCFEDSTELPRGEK